MNHAIRELQITLRHCAQFAAGRLLLYTLAGWIGWTLAHTFHHAVLWMRLSPPPDAVNIGASLQRVANTIGQAFHR
jgi:hypothetical protein